MASDHGKVLMKDVLPEEIINRKKSPYPKTHNPNYTKIVKEGLRKIMKDENAPINELLNRESRKLSLYR